MRKTDNDVKEVVNQVQKIITSKYMAVFVQAIYGVDIRLIVANSNELSTNLTNDPRGTAQLSALGCGGSLTGKHYDRIFTDDIVNIDDRISKATRDKTKLIYQELQNIKNHDGRIFNTGTPWHKEDCFTLMPNISKYDCYHTGIMTQELIDEKKAGMTASLFAANYELKFIADEDVIFDNPNLDADISLCEQGDSHIDAAYGGADYTAFTVCKKRGDDYYIFGKLWHKHVDDVLEDCINYHNSLMAGKLYCEDNADKKYLAKEIRKRGVRVVSYHENQNKYIKITSYLKVAWPHVFFVFGTDADYINQILDYNENAEHDDACFTAGTKIATIFGNKCIEDIRHGDYVITPAGARKVIACGITGIKPTVCWNGTMVTKNHKIYDKTNNAFLPLDSLTSSVRYDMISLKELILWKAKLLYLMGMSIGEAQRADIISCTQQQTKKEKTQNNCIEQCGNFTMEKFRKDIKYITLMAISTIMTFPIWIAYLLGNTYQCILRKICKMKNQSKNLYKPDKQLQKNGIKATQEENGTNNISTNHFQKRGKKKKESANIAERRFLEQSEQDFVVNCVEQETGQKTKYMSRNVMFAESSLKQGKAKRSIVQETVNQNFITAKRTVYNLQVENAGCYYANGKLVSNCDSCASIIRQKYFTKENNYDSPFGE